MVQPVTPDPTSGPAWSDDDLARIGDAEELGVSSVRPDGSDRPFVTIWVVRADGALYVRSAHGSTNPWFRRAQAAGTGRVRAGGVERRVRFVVPDRAEQAAVDAAYHAKYDRYGPRIVGSVTGPDVGATTFRLEPAGS